MDPELEGLSRSLVVELAGSIGFRDSRLVQKILWPMFRPATNALATLGLTFDRNVLDHGFSRATGIVLENFSTSVTSRGAEKVPPEGPLLVVSNHPGTYDSLVIASQLKRDDLNIITGDIPFLRKLPHISAHFLSVTQQVADRMLAVRKAIRHLKSGGAVLLFGYGHIDPDPSVYSDAESCINHWSPSIGLIAKTVPDIHILLTVVSHVVSSKWRNSILYRLRKDPIDRRRLVEFGQVIYQLLFPHRLLTAPKITINSPITFEELGGKERPTTVLSEVLNREKGLLADHISWAMKT